MASNSFKGNQKNRNKKISKEDRRLIHTKKRSKREYDVQPMARTTLKDVEGKTVKVEGVLKYFKSNDPMQHALITDVEIDGIKYDHIWVRFSIEDRKKLKLCSKGTTIIFTGVVYRYTKRHDRQVGIKYGVREVKLVREC